MPDPLTKRISIEDLIRRIAVLEAEQDAHCRRCTRGLATVALVLALLATAAVAAVVPDAIVARSFRLVDSSGAELARLAPSDSGSVALTLYEASGAVVTELVLASSEPLLRVSGARSAEAKKTADSLAPLSAAPPQATAPSARPGAPSRGPIIDWGEPPAGGSDDDFDWAD